MSHSPADRFDTASLRAAVLDAWRASPTRYLEDTNVEDDYALGAYRDRLFVELAQNAVDAARAAGVPARVRVTFEADRLVVANAGAPLDRAAVESLASMRASTKRGETSVGRFGVGFASVLAVSDAPAIASRDGGVRFSRTDTGALMQADPALAGKLDQHPPPVLRLPFPYESSEFETSAYGDSDFETVVVLPWRDDSALERALEAVRAIDDALFIALPELSEVVVVGAPDDVPRHWSAVTDAGVRTVTADGATRRWGLHDRSGAWSDADLTDAPHEQRRRRGWQLAWAVPLTASKHPAPWNADHDGRWPPRVLHAPTPTDEVLSMPALLVGTFPVDPSRRRLAAGRPTEVMVESAVDAYVDVVGAYVREVDVAAADLVPGADLVGPLDGRIRAAVRERLAETRWVPRASDGSAACPADLVAVEPPEPTLVRVLAPHLSDLVAPEWLAATPMLRGLGLTTRRWSDVWDVLACLPLTPEMWHEVYGAAAGLDRASLEGLPVLLADGRVVRDARQCVVSDDGDAADDLQSLGLAVVDDAAMHPLLERVGAQPFDARAHLAGIATQLKAALVDDLAEARRLLAAIVSVLSGSAVRPGELTALGETPVPTQTGDWRPAAQVVLPQTALADLADADVLLEESLAARHRDGWLALGVLGALTVVSVSDTPMEPRVWDTMMVDGGDWCVDTAELLGTRSPDELLVVSAAVVRGIELVEASELETALASLGAPGVRAAVVEPAIVLDPRGRARPVPAPAAWWLADSPLFQGRAAPLVRLPGDERLAPFFDVVDVVGEPDLELLEAIGVHTTLDSWLERPDGASELLSAMVDPAVELPDELVPELYAALGRGDHEIDDVVVPKRLLARSGGRWQPVEASGVVVAVAPHHAHVTTGPFVPGDEALADLLDLDVSDDGTYGAAGMARSGAQRAVPDVVARHVRTQQYREHDLLTVNGQEVDWWVTDDGEVHACTLDGLAHALAWADRRWTRRWELAARLSGAADVERDMLDDCYGD